MRGKCVKSAILEPLRYRISETVRDICHLLLVTTNRKWLTGSLVQGRFSTFVERLINC